MLQRADDLNKDKFYTKLQLLTISILKYLVIIGKNWNAVAKNSAIGKYGIGVRRANGGIRVLRFAKEYFVTNTFF